MPESEILQDLETIKTNVKKLKAVDALCAEILATLTLARNQTHVPQELKNYASVWMSQYRQINERTAAYESKPDSTPNPGFFPKIKPIIEKILVASPGTRVTVNEYRGMVMWVKTELSEANLAETYYGIKFDDNEIVQMHHTSQVIKDLNYAPPQKEIITIPNPAAEPTPQPNHGLQCHCFKCDYG